MIKIKVLTVNAVDKDALVECLEKLPELITEGEDEGFSRGCKWWIDDKEVAE